jgi:hypothetical protein
MTAGLWKDSPWRQPMALKYFNAPNRGEREYAPGLDGCRV